MERDSPRSGLQSNRIAEAQTMRLEAPTPPPGQGSFTNGYSEPVMHDRQGSAAVGRGHEEKEVQRSTTTLVENDVVVTKRTDAIVVGQPLIGVGLTACDSDAIDGSNSLACSCPVSVLRNGSSSELDVNLCHFSDSSGYSSERDSMPLFSVIETVPPTLVACNAGVAALGSDLRNGLSTSSALQLSSSSSAAKTNDLDNSVCQTVGSACCKTGVATTRATSAPIASGCSDVIASATTTTGACTVSAQVSCSDTVASATSSSATSKHVDIVTRATSSATSKNVDMVTSATSSPATTKHVDTVASATSSTATSKNVDMVTSATCSPATTKHVDTVASATSSTATSKPVDIFASATCSPATSKHVDTVASATSSTATIKHVDMVASATSSATSRHVDIVASATSSAATSKHVDIVASATSSTVTSKHVDIVTSATSSPATSKHVDTVGSASKLSAAASSQSIVVESGRSTTIVCPSDTSAYETFPLLDKRVSGDAMEKRKSTGDVESVRSRPSLNSKQRYSDVPVIDHSSDMIPGELDRDRHGSLPLSPHQMEESPKKLVRDETTTPRSEGILVSNVQTTIVPMVATAANVASNATGARSELAPDRTTHLDDPHPKKRYDRRSVTSISSDSRMEMRSDLAPISPGCIVMSQSTEKITGGGGGGCGGRNPSNARNVQFFPGGGIVRSSRSQENYFDSGDITCVDIDLDDNIASSVDALHYDTSSMASLDSMGVPDWPIDGSESDLSLHATDHEKCFKRSEPDRASLPATLVPTDAHSVSAPTTTQSGLSESALQASKSPAVGQVLQFKAKQAAALTTSRSDDQRPAAGHGIALSINSQEVEAAFGPQNRCAAGADDVSLSIPSTDEPKQGGTVGLKSTTTTVSQSVQSSSSGSAGMQQKDLSGEPSTKTSVSSFASSSTDDAEDDDDDNDADEGDDVRSEDLEFLLLRDESLFRQPTKDVDRPSAARLAKRLFYLHGFKKGDVSRHLSKKNSFSQLVGEEYLKYFDFSGEALDSALRRFMKHMTIYGETQDRERLLAHFSCRYQQCNPDIFKSEDCCHTLACALLLLNQDLNGLNIGRKITLLEFISNLADMNDGEQFSKELLKSFYQSIKNQPLEFEAEELHDAGGTLSGGPATGGQVAAAAQPRFVSYNPFYEIPDPSNAVEFKKGYVMRKCCLEPDGRKTPLGKRGWKMFYSTLRDMVLHLHIDEHGFKRNQHYTSASNAIHIHHSLATKATDYQKKNHVFRLQTSDLAQFLIQTSDSKECQEWIDAINFVAASYSAPSPISSIASQKRFQRPLLPSTYTRLNLREQINHHEKMIVEFERELLEHRKNPPEKGAKTRLIQDYCKKENYLKFELKRYKTYCRLLQYKMSTFPELEPSLAEIAIGEVDELSLSGSPIESPFDNHGPNFFQSSSADSHTSYASSSASSGLHF